MRSLPTLALLASLSGCTLFFSRGEQPDQCDLLDEPAIAQAPLRNPEVLTCESFGGGGGCDPSCGPCPAIAERIAEPTPPIPSWGICGGACDGLDESACGFDDTCRIVRDVRCAIDGTCRTDFVGCFATDMFVDPAVTCRDAVDGTTCSRNPACTAFHRGESPCGTDAICPREFSLCMDEGASPGKCFEPALCDITTPPCPTGTIAGVIDGCFSGACIPEQDCEKSL